MATRRTASVAAKIGDLAQVRREPCVIVQLPTSTDKDCISITASGHSLRHSLKDISFLSPNWSFATPSNSSSASNQQQQQQSKVPVGLNADSSTLLAASNIPASIISHLSQFDQTVDRLIHEKTAKFAALYAEFKTSQNREFITVQEAASWVFHGLDGALAVENASVTPAQMCAAQLYLSRNPKWFQLDAAAGSNMLVEINARFLLKNRDEVDDFVWLEKQAKGSRPGKELKEFLEKAMILIEWAANHPAIDSSLLKPESAKTAEYNRPTDITFTESDLKFIAAIKSAAFNPASIRNANPHTELVNRGILSRLPHGYAKKATRSMLNGPNASGRGLDALRLLKDLGVLTPWENTTIHTAAGEGAGALDALDGHGFSEWADIAVSESQTWADELLAEPVLYSEEQAPKQTTGVTEEGKSQLTFSADALAKGNDTESALFRAVKKHTVFPQTPVQDEFFSRDVFESKRRDFGDVPVYVIDSPTAQELDDGISIEETAEGSWIHVHIADPTAYLPPSHPLSMLAQLRGTSMYLPERHYPMLPDILSNARFNLGKSHCALTFSARLGSDGEIVDYKISPSVIKNVKILHYRTVNDVLDWSNVYGFSLPPEERTPWVNKALNELSPKEGVKSQLDDKSVSELRKLQELMYRHLKLRISRGGFSSDQPGFGVKVVPYPLPITPESPNVPFQYEEQQQSPPLVLFDPNQASHLEPSSNLVSECMVMANRVAAKFCTEHNIPAIYRGQEPLKPASSPLESSTITDALASIDPVSGVMPYTYFKNILPFFSPGSHTMQPASHYSLGIRAGGTSASDFGGYMKVTSPLRRYKDMMLHWLIKSQLLAESDPSRAVSCPFSSTDVETISTRINDIEKRTDKLSTASHKYWALEWILRREVLWRCGASEKTVFSGVATEMEHLKDVGIGLPGIGAGPRGPVIWSDEYRGVVEWGVPSSKWEVGYNQRCIRPTYQVVIGSILNTRFGLGLLGNLGGIQARVDLKAERYVGDIVTCVVDTIDPAAGVLIVKEL
ncbi:RNB-domain-containing protein [Rhizoclosmatium globosum]|uniref:RNB-domain-containing protein n=1 Tax=Rhizoclosmatium globosum TaxID=329046 RepID=A0A1Y2CRH9_9FUNG|nr:RNB-domain-containing protein [Rhizoclosmatium globosum]|eukprot:ORY49593.1 RNB-domain-containing protein [Rhizoclosmatium globosum]